MGGSVYDKINKMTKRQNIKIIIILVLVAIIFTIFNFTDFSKDIKNFFFLISSPVQKSFWQAGKNVSVFFTGILEGKIIKEELNNLELKNQELLSQIVALKELKKENEALREILGLGLEKESRLMLAQIISKDISQDSILINKGKKDGVLEGLPVITGQKVLLGKISQVYERFSEVILISNKKSSFEAKIMDKEIYGLVRGKGSLDLYFDLIPKDKEVSSGDMVVTAVLGGDFPSGILLGSIKEVKRSDIESFQQAEIISAFDLNKIDYLFIVTGF